VSIDLAEAAHVHRSRKGRRITRLRRHVISKLCALSIIALVLTPFTAPFKTYDLADSRSDHAHDALPKDKIGADEKLAGVSEESVAAPVLNIVSVEPSPRPSQIRERQLHATILRI
jgi:hypothetical protein